MSNAMRVTPYRFAHDVLDNKSVRSVMYTRIHYKSEEHKKTYSPNRFVMIAEPRAFRSRPRTRWPDTFLHLILMYKPSLYTYRFITSARIHVSIYICMYTCRRITFIKYDTIRKRYSKLTYRELGKQYRAYNCGMKTIKVWTFYFPIRTHLLLFTCYSTAIEHCTVVVKFRTNEIVFHSWKLKQNHSGKKIKETIVLCIYKLSPSKGYVVHSV